MKIKKFLSLAIVMTMLLGLPEVRTVSADVIADASIKTESVVASDSGVITPDSSEEVSEDTLESGSPAIKVDDMSYFQPPFSIEKTADINNLKSTDTNQAFFNGYNELNVVYLGGSITNGDGDSTENYSKCWRNQVTGYLRTVNPNTTINAHNAAMSGTPSQWGYYRVARDVLAYNPDVVFVEFAVNDQVQTSNDSKKYIESIVRALGRAEKVPMVIFVYTTTTAFVSRVEEHEEIAQYYGIPSVNLREYIKDSINGGTLTYSDIWDLEKDTTHPTSNGYDIYSQYIINQLNSDPAYYLKQMTMRETPYTSDALDCTPQIQNLADTAVPSGWTTGNIKNLTTDVESSIVGTKYTYNFNGSMFVVRHGAGPGYGKMKVTIDGISSIVDCYYSYDSIEMWYVREKLSKTRHTATIEVLNDKNGSSTGNKIALANFVTDSDQTILEGTVSSTVNGVTDLAVDTGKIELDFTGDVNIDELSENVVFTKADGTSLRGSYYVKSGIDSTKAEIVFGELELSTDYKIVVTESITSLGYNANVDTTFTFKTDESDTVVTPEILYTSIKNGATDVSTKASTFEIAYTTDISAAILDGVTIKDSDDTTVSCTAYFNEQTRKILLSYNTLSLDKVYTVTIPAQTSTDGLAVAQQTITFSTETVNFKYVSSDLASFANVGRNIGSIKLTFSEDVDTGTVSGITLGDNLGNSANNLKISVTANTCILTFATLKASANYVITIPESVKSDTGDALIATKINFSTEDNYYINDDFEGYTLSDTGDTHPETGGLISYTSDNTVNDVSNIYVKAEADGNQYLEIYGKPSSSKDNVAKISIDTAVSGTFAIEMSLRKPANNTVPISIGKSYNSSYVNTFKINNDGSVAVADGVSYAPTTTNRITASGYGWHNVKFVYKPLSTGCYSVDAYDNGVYKLTVTTTLTNITSVLLGCVYNNQIVDGYLDIDNLKVYYIGAPKISGVSLDNNMMSTNENKFDIYFNTALDSSTVNSTNIVLKHGDTVIQTKGTYDLTVNKYTLYLLESLVEEEYYTVTFDGVMSANQFVMTETYIFKASGPPQFRYISSEVEDKTDISPAVGSIAVVFSDPVDAATVSGITLSDTDGNFYDIASVDVADKTCILNLYTLNENTSYIISLPSSVHSKGGSPLTENTVEFSTASSYFLMQDFEGYTLSGTEDTHPETDGLMKYISNNIADNASNMYIKADFDGNQYLEIYGAANSKTDNYAKINIDAEGTKTIAVEMSLRKLSYDSIPIAITKPYKTAFVNAFKITNDGAVSVADGVNYTTISSSNRLTDAGYCWHNVKFVYKPLSTGYYSVDAYDNGTYKMTVTTTLDNITSIMLGCVYNNTAADGYLDIDDVKVYYVNPPSILGTSLKNDMININSGSFGIYFSTAMNPATLNTTNVVVKQGEELVSYTGTYDSVNKKFVIGFSDVLTSGETFTVSIKNIYSENGMALANTSYTFTTEGSLNFKLYSSSLSSPTDVSVKIGSIVLTFTKGIDATTANGITLKKKSGESAENIKYSVSGKTCTISFAALAYSTEYFLNLPATVKDIDGNLLAAQQIMFTTASKYVLYEDFESFVLGDSEMHPDIGGDILYVSDNTPDDASNIYVKADGDGNKYLQIYGAAGGRTDNSASVSLDVTEGKTAVIEFRERKSVSDSAEIPTAIARTYGGTSYKNVLKLNKDCGVGIADGLVAGTDYYTLATNRLTDSTTDWHDIRLVYTPDKTTGCYNIDIYSEGVYKMTVYTSYTDITKVMLACVYNNQTFDGTVDIDNISVYYTEAPKLAGTTLQNESMDVNQDGFGIYFDSEMNTSSVNNTNIVVRQGDEVIATTGAYDSSKFKYTMKFTDVLTSGGTYTVTFTNVLSKERLQLSGMYTFTATGKIKFAFVSTDLSATTNVKANIGKIALIFRDVVDDSTISGITLKDINETPADNISATVKGNTVTLSFIVLNASTEYIIDIPANVASIDGAVLGLAQQIRFTTASNYTLMENFEEYELSDTEDTHPVTDENILYVSGGSSGISNMYVETDGDNKYLRIYGIANTNKDNTASIAVDVTGNRTAVVELSLRKTSSDNIPRSIGKPFNGTATLNVLHTNPDSSLATDSARLTGASYGWQNIKLVYTPASTGYYNIDMYNMGEYVMTLTTTLTDITSIMLGNVYNNTSTDGWLDLDNINVYYADAPRIFSTSLNGDIINAREDSFDMFFDTPMLASTVTSDNIVVWHGEDVVETFGTYDALKKKYTICFLDYLLPGETYMVKFGDVLSKDRLEILSSYTFTATSLNISAKEAYFTTIIGGNSISEIGTTTSLYANVTLRNNTSSTQAATVIMAIYNREGCTEIIYSEDYALDGMQIRNICNLGAAGLTFDAGSYAKIFIWDSMNTLCPIISKPVKIQ